MAKNNLAGSHRDGNYVLVLPVVSRDEISSQAQRQPLGASQNKPEAKAQGQEILVENLKKH